MGAMSEQAGPTVPVQLGSIGRFARPHQANDSPTALEIGLNGINRLANAAIFGGSAGSKPKTFVGVYTHQLPVTSSA